MSPNNLINSNNTFENDPSIEDPKDINLYLPNALSIFIPSFAFKNLFNLDEWSLVVVKHIKQS